jgi:hypothetical protein
MSDNAIVKANSRTCKLVEGHQIGTGWLAAIAGHGRGENGLYTRTEYTLNSKLWFPHGWNIPHMRATCPKIFHFIYIFIRIIMY